MTDPVPKNIFKASAELLEAAKAKGVTIGVVESCTGGLLGAAITAMPGSSAVFMGGLLTYSNALKTELADVTPASILAHGAVSDVVAGEMAQGGRERLGVDICISITGIAGPGGGSKAKPVGTVFFGLSTARGTSTDHQLFDASSRNRVRDYATIHAMKMLRQAVAEIAADR